MSQNCQKYQELLENWKTKLEEFRGLLDEFKEGGNIDLKNELEKKKKETKEAEKEFKEFSQEIIDTKNYLNNNIQRERLKDDLSKIELNQNTDWKVIEKLSKIKDIEVDLTNIKPELKNRITKWAGSIIDKSQDDLSYDSLVKVGGFLNAWNTQFFSANALEKVGGYLDAWEAQFFSANALVEVGGYLDAQKAQSFSANALEKVGGDLYVQNTQSFSANALVEVGGSLHATNAQSFSADSLVKVGGYLNARNAQSFFADSLVEVGLTIHANNSERFIAPILTTVQEIQLSKSKYFQFFKENGEFDWAEAEASAQKGGKGIIIPENVREKLDWLDL